MIPDRYSTLGKTFKGKRTRRNEAEQISVKNCGTKDGATAEERHKLSPVPEDPYEMMGLQKTTITIKYGNGEEEKGSRDRVVLAPTAVEKTGNESYSFSKTQKEDGIWPALNHKEAMTAVVRFSIKLSASLTTGDRALLNFEKEGASEQETNQLYTVEQILDNAYRKGKLLYNVKW